MKFRLLSGVATMAATVGLQVVVILIAMPAAAGTSIRELVERSHGSLLLGLAISSAVWLALSIVTLVGALFLGRRPTAVALLSGGAALVLSWPLYLVVEVSATSYNAAREVWPDWVASGLFFGGLAMIIGALARWRRPARRRSAVVAPGRDQP